MLSPSIKNYIQVEDFDVNGGDSKFIKDYLYPYFKDLYKDLILRCLSSTAIQAKKLDKVTFIEYCNLPGIINDRFFKMLDINSDGLITEGSFIQCMTMVFISDLDTRMRLTFNMYDFNGDGLISKEDVRIVLSYIPFKREANTNVQTKQN